MRRRRRDATTLDCAKKHCLDKGVLSRDVLESA